jgi:hypothetical protein
MSKQGEVVTDLGEITFRTGRVLKFQHLAFEGTNQFRFQNVTSEGRAFDTTIPMAKLGGLRAALARIDDAGRVIAAKEEAAIVVSRGPSQGKRATP